jgi:hypothetical protein
MQPSKRGCRGEVGLSTGKQQLMRRHYSSIAVTQQTCSGSAMAVHRTTCCWMAASTQAHTSHRCVPAVPCQVASWPLQPQDAAIAWVKALPKGAVVADFGCGDARLAASVPQVGWGAHARGERRGGGVIPTH